MYHCASAVAAAAAVSVHILTHVLFLVCILAGQQRCSNKMDKIEFTLYGSVGKHKIRIQTIYLQIAAVNSYGIESISMVIPFRTT